MADSSRYIHISLGVYVLEKWRNLKDRVFAKSVVDEGVPSSEVVSTVIQNSSINDLNTDIATYLASSTKRFHSASAITLLSLQYTVIIYEVNNS